MVLIRMDGWAEQARILQTCPPMCVLHACADRSMSRGTKEPGDQARTLTISLAGGQVSTYPPNKTAPPPKKDPSRLLQDFQAHHDSHHEFLQAFSPLSATRRGGGAHLQLGDEEVRSGLGPLQQFGAEPLDGVLVEAVGRLVRAAGEQVLLEEVLVEAVGRARLGHRLQN